LVCTNGMVVSDGTFQRISIKHSGSALTTPYNLRY
jgi:Domain of unknown function (DUF932)